MSTVIHQSQMHILLTDMFAILSMTAVVHLCKHANLVKLTVQLALYLAVLLTLKLKQQLTEQLAVNLTTLACVHSVTWDVCGVPGRGLAVVYRVTSEGCQHQASVTEAAMLHCTIACWKSIIGHSPRFKSIRGSMQWVTLGKLAKPCNAHGSPALAPTATDAYLGPCAVRLEVHSDSPSTARVSGIIHLDMCHADWVPVEDVHPGHIDPHDLGGQHICHMAPSEG